MMRSLTPKKAALVSLVAKLTTSLLAMLLLLPPKAHPQSIATNWTEAARELARQIAEKVGSPSNVSLTIKNVSGLSGGDEAEIRRAVESQLSSAGLRMVKPEQSVADIRLTLSRNVQEWLWVAELHHGNSSEALLVPVLIRQTGPLTGVSSAITLHKTLIWAEPDARAVLDVAVLGGGSNPNALLVLDSSMVSLYRMQSSHWELEQAQPIPRSRPWPRDLRGRIIMGHDRKFEAYLPGMKCTGSADSGLTMECHAADDPWPLGASDDGPRAFLGARNFFTGAMTSGSGNAAPFFSAAPAQADSKGSLLFAGTDGMLRLSGSPGTGMRGWGSDLVGVRSECGHNWQALFSGAGDYTQSDSVRAGEVEGSTVVPVSPPLDFGGPITALWTAADGNAAIAVCKNLSTGRYEAFSISVSCR